MGSGNSRMRTGPPRRRKPSHAACFLCGGASAAAAAAADDGSDLTDVCSLLLWDYPFSSQSLNALFYQND